MIRPGPLAIVMLVLASSTTLAEDPRPTREAARADLEKLQGTWTLVSMEVEGQAAPPKAIEGQSAVYEGDAVTLMDGETVRRRGIVTLEPTRRPAAINTWDQDGPREDRTTPGIYELKGQTLKLCFARPDDRRPDEFATGRGTGYILLVYESQDTLTSITRGPSRSVTHYRANLDQRLTFLFDFLGRRFVF